jgi:pseudaminic acid cytidylyltransferase
LKKPIVIIPARGGSKRIPNKNIALIDGVPMITLVIEKLLSFDIFEKIYVSTDSAKIAEISISAGACVPQLRKSEFSDDFIPFELAIRNFIQINRLDMQDLDIMCVYPQSIFIELDSVRDAIKLLEKPNSGFVISACRYSPNPLRHTFVETGESNKILFPENNTTRSQDLTDVYFDVGTFYLANSKNWLETNEFWYEKEFSFIEIKKEFAIDVDTADDLENLIRTYKSLNNN